jgi:hypothetical protein
MMRFTQSYHTRALVPTPPPAPPAGPSKLNISNNNNLLNQSEIYPGAHASEFQPPSGERVSSGIPAVNMWKRFQMPAHRRRDRSDRSALHALRWSGAEEAKTQMHRAMAQGSHVHWRELRVPCRRDDAGKSTIAVAPCALDELHRFALLLRCGEM